MKSNLTIEEKLAGWKNNPLPYVNQHYENFVYSGIDILKIARLTEQKLINYYNIPENKKYLITEKEASQLAQNVGGQFQRYWVEVLKNEYPTMGFRRGDANEPDVVCMTNPYLNHELKSSTSDRVYGNGWQRYTYYSPNFSNHLGNKNASSKPVEENHYIHVKYQLPISFEDSIEMTFVSYLYVKPDDIKIGKKRNASLKKESANNIIIMLYENTSRIEKILEKEKMLGKTYKRNKIASTNKVISQNNNLVISLTPAQTQAIVISWLQTEGYSVTINKTTGKPKINIPGENKEGHYEKAFKQFREDLLNMCHIKTSITASDKLRTCTIVNNLPKTYKKKA